MKLNILVYNPSEEIASWRARSAPVCALCSGVAGATACPDWPKKLPGSRSSDLKRLGMKRSSSLGEVSLGVWKGRLFLVLVHLSFANHPPNGSLHIIAVKTELIVDGRTDNDKEIPIRSSKGKKYHDMNIQQY